MYHSLLYIVEKLPRVVIIENVRGLTFRRHARLQHVKGCLQGVGYTLHVRILCTSESGVPQSRGRCYIVGVRSPRVPFKWPRTLPVVKLESFLYIRRVNLGHPLSRRQQTLQGQEPLPHTQPGRGHQCAEASPAPLFLDMGATRGFHAGPHCT